MRQLVRLRVACVAPESGLARSCIPLTVLTVLCLTVGSAWASFPGRNGAIVLGWTGESAYRAGPFHTSIRAIDPRSRRMRVLRDCPLGAGPSYVDCIVSAPRFSPDGRAIAFSVQTVPDLSRPFLPWQFRPGLGTMASDGSGLEELPTEHRYWALAWSPAADRFLLQRELVMPDAARSSAIFLAATDRSELTQVTSAWSATPDWSSTGEVAFVGDTSADPGCLSNCQDVFITRLGGAPRRLTYRGGSSPSWSPHGTKLAFVRVRRGQPDVYIVNRDGSRMRRLTGRGGYGPAWSPDGKWIAFVRFGDLRVIRTTGRGGRRLVNPPTGPESIDGPAVGSVDWQPIPRR